MATSHGHITVADEMEVSSDAGRRLQDEDDDLIDYSDEEQVDNDVLPTEPLEADENMMDDGSEAQQYDETMIEDANHMQEPLTHEEELHDYSPEDDVLDRDDIDLVYLDDNFEEEPAQPVDAALSKVQSAADSHHSGELRAQHPEHSLGDENVDPALVQDSRQEHLLDHLREPEERHEDRTNPISTEEQRLEGPSAKNDPEGLETLEDFHDYGDEESFSGPDHDDDPVAAHEHEEDHTEDIQPSVYLDGHETPHNTVDEQPAASPRTYEHPCQLVVYSDDRLCDLHEQFLFPTLVDHTISEGFLDDVKLFKKPLKTLLDGCRDKLASEHLDMYQLVLAFDSLGLRIGEDSTSASACCLENIVDVYSALWRNQGVSVPDPLYMSITVEHSFYKQFDQLRMSSNEGRTFADVAQFDQNYAAEDGATGDADNASEQGEPNDAQRVNEESAHDAFHVGDETEGEDFVDFASNVEADEVHEADSYPNDNVDLTAHQATLEETQASTMTSQQGINNAVAPAVLDENADLKTHADPEADDGAEQAIEDRYPYEDPEDAGAEIGTDDQLAELSEHQTKTELAQKSPVEAQAVSILATHQTDEPATSSKTPHALDDEDEVKLDFSDDEDGKGPSDVANPHNFAAASHMSDTAHASGAELASQKDNDDALVSTPAVGVEAALSKPKPSLKSVLSSEEQLSIEDQEFWADFEKRNPDSGLSPSNSKVTTPVEAGARRVPYDVEDDLIDYSDDEDDIKQQKKDAPPQETSVAAAEGDSTQDSLSRKRALDQIDEPVDPTDDLTNTKKTRSQ